MQNYPIRVARGIGLPRSTHEWLRMALRLLTLGLFVAGRRTLLLGLLRGLLTCLTTMMLSGILFAGLIIWWLMAIR